MSWVFTTGTSYKECNILGELKREYISGLMSSRSKNQIINRRIVSRWAGECGFIFDSDMVHPLLKTNWRRDRMFNFGIFVVWSALIVDRWLMVAS